ncbi:hypothetical protein [Tabrizicola sp. YIM 78059]|uniref:hypothetical protein n=1 Tax=Tabrizicola sp. YIM 78059 TaxID=2529861 RepID=UPI0010AAA499|nr:hypothetical protein [Tabrizicola sp. YIM 78059]
MAIEDLLDEARDALLAGDLAALERIGTGIEAQAQTLSVPDKATAERLQQKAERNARLLEAAARGVKAALGRLTEITTSPTLTTYDSRGRRAEVGDGTSSALGRF